MPHCDSRKSAYSGQSGSGFPAEIFPVQRVVMHSDLIQVHTFLTYSASSFSFSHSKKALSFAP